MGIHLKLIDAVSVPGDPNRPNDDAWSARPRFAAVLDGATGLGARLLPYASDAAWLAKEGAERLAAHSRSLGGQALIKVVLSEIEGAFAQERIRAPLERFEMPMAFLMMIEAGDGGLTASWFGDCSAMVRRPGEAVLVIGDALENRSQETDRAAALGAAVGTDPAGALSRPEFLADRRAARNLHNTGDGPWVFAPELACADHVQTETIDAPKASLALVASDGFAALISDYGVYDPDSLMETAVDHGLQRLLTELRAIEDADPGGKRFPRFKKSDDATALLLQIVDQDE